MSARLQEIMGFRGVKAVDISREGGIDPSTLSKVINSKRRMSETWASRLAPILRVPKESFFEAVGTPIRGIDTQPDIPLELPPGVTVGMPDPAAELGKGRPVNRSSPDRPRGILVPELDVRAAGGHGGLDLNLDANGQHVVLAEWMIPGDYLRANTPDVAAVKIIRVVGDSMEPEYPASDRVLVDTSHRSPSPPGVYVVWDGFGLVLKRLEAIIGSDPPRVRLSSANPAYPPYEVAVDTLIVQGRVLAKWVWK